jgi:PhnB protein
MRLIVGMLPLLPNCSGHGAGQLNSKGHDMAALEAYLFFNGTCAEAMRFYERVLGGKIEMMMTHGEAPLANQMPHINRNNILHARLKVGAHALLASDWSAPAPFPGSSGFSMSMNYDTIEESHRIFAALAQGGTITMPIQATFWSSAFGMLVDRFGVLWMVNGPAPAA